MVPRFLHHTPAAQIPSRLNYIHWVEDLIASGPRGSWLAGDRTGPRGGGGSSSSRRSGGGGGGSSGGGGGRDGGGSSSSGGGGGGGDGSGPRAAGAVRIVDIGTGASAIYPLLARAMSGWRAIATESAVDL